MPESDNYYLLPCHNEDVLLNENIKFTQWDLIVEKLEKPISTLKQLEEVLLYFLPSTVNSLCNLRLVIDSLTQDERSLFFSFTLPKIQEIALQLPNLFEDGKIKLLKQITEEYCTNNNKQSASNNNNNYVVESIKFSRKQVCCLLSHQFFCTIDSQRKQKYTINFHQWISAGNANAMMMAAISSSLPTSFVYLKSLILYFIEYTLYEQEANQCAPIQIFRKSLSAKEIKPSNNTKNTNDTEHHIPTLDDSIAHWKNCSLPIMKSSQLNVCLEGEIGNPKSWKDSSHTSNEVEIDFANKSIGFGTHGTQEEIIFGTSPELCVAVLLCEPMLDNECIIIKGARRVSIHSGYGRSLRYVSPVSSILSSKNTETKGESNNHSSQQLSELKRWENRVVVAMDAIEFDTFESSAVATQLKAEHFTRELNKVYCAFASPINNLQFSSIGTGNWGCGAFGGDKETKALIQLMAFSVASAVSSATSPCSTSLNFYCFGDKQFAEQLSSLLPTLEAKQIATVGALFQRILQADETVSSTVKFLSS